VPEVTANGIAQVEQFFSVGAGSTGKQLGGDRVRGAAQSLA